MGLLALAGGGLGLGLAKRALVDKPREDAATKLASATDRYAPWTGLHGQLPTRGSYISSGLQGAGAGLMLGQGIGSAQKALAEGGAASAAAASAPNVPSAPSSYTGALGQIGGAGSTLPPMPDSLQMPGMGGGQQPGQPSWQNLGPWGKMAMNTKAPTIPGGAYGPAF